MSKLWQKNWQLDQFIEQFETQTDLQLDQQLVYCDALGSIAHGKMLNQIGILTNQEFDGLKKGLLEVIELDKQGQFILQLGDEDVHSKIENYLTEKVGEAGKKIHTGRSRNDQALTTIRLFTKHQLLNTWQATLSLATSLHQLASKHEFVPMPGYTHMQRAMPSSVGMWAAAITEGLLDSLQQLQAAYQLNDQSPLGSAAGFGVPLKLDRQLTADLLGFTKVQNNSLYCQNSRGKLEATIIATLVSIMMDINKLASDVLLYTTSEFQLFQVAPVLCTGSSIMPQKKNVDIAELLRSKLHLMLGYYTQMVGLSGNLISGYNRDLQDSKKPLFESLQLGHSSLQAATILADHLTPNPERMAAALDPTIFATHQTLTLVNQGTPFREAYHQVGQNLEQLNSLEPQQVVKDTSHVGSTGNLGLKQLSSHINQSQKTYQATQDKFNQTIENLLSANS